MHYGIENCLFSKSIASDYLSSVNEQLRVREETPYAFNGKKTVPNVNYVQHQIKLKGKLKQSQSTLVNFSQGKSVSEDYVLSEVFHFLNDANMALKKYRERLQVKFGDFFRETYIDTHHDQRSVRTTHQPQRSS